MSLQSRLQDDLKNAMRSGDTTRRSVIRYLRSEIRNVEIARHKTLDDEGVLGVLARQAQQRRESIEAYGKGNRQDLVEKEEAELRILLEYLPQQMSTEEVSALVKQVIQESGSVGPQDMGRVMGRIMPRVKGRADGRQVSAVVSALLAEMTE